MSYEIVKNIKLMKTEDSYYYARITSASNNVTPRYYDNWDYGKNKHYNKEQLEKELLLDFYKGNLQKGSSRYKKAVDDAEYKPELFNEVKRISHVLNRVNKRYWTIKEATPRKKELSNLIDKLCVAYDDRIQEVLYKELYSNDTIKGIIIYDKYTNSYVNRVLTRKYYTSSVKTIITNKNTINRVLYSSQSQWWQDNFEVEVVK